MISNLTVLTTEVGWIMTRTEEKSSVMPGPEPDVEDLGYLLVEISKLHRVRSLTT